MSADDWDEVVAWVCVVGFVVYLVVNIIGGFESWAR
jgi:hypothetical protein